jgi:hypothetical protein
MLYAMSLFAANSSCLRACLRAGCTVCRIALLGRLKKVAGVLYCIVRASEKGRRGIVLYC